MSNFVFQRPVDGSPRQHREPMSGNCSDCGAEELMRYPVLSEGGWYIAVKCQACLCSISREPWHRLGHVRLLSDDLD